MLRATASHELLVLDRVRLPDSHNVDNREMAIATVKLMVGRGEKSSLEVLERLCAVPTGRIALMGGDALVPKQLPGDVTQAFSHSAEQRQAAPESIQADARPLALGNCMQQSLDLQDVGSCP